MLKKKEEKKIKDNRINELVNQIRSLYQNEQVINEDIVEKMKDLRNVFIELEQPTLVKSIRLVYEYADAVGEFLIDAWEEEGGVSSFEYFLYLISNAHNKYNRDEIKAMNDYLKARLAGEDAEFVRPDEETDE
jgi:hypothetical protein